MELLNNLMIGFGVAFTPENLTYVAQVLPWQLLAWARSLPAALPPC